MKTYLSVLALLALTIGSAHADLAPAPGAVIEPIPQAFEKSVLATGLGNPHNMVVGPDGALWVTEQITRRVTRVNPKTGAVVVAVEIRDAVYSDKSQDGVLGLALHPDLLKGRGRDYVYVSLTYAAGGSAEFPNRTAIRRYTYDAKTQKLTSPIDLVKGLPSAHDHQSARLLFGPDNKLYYSIGDQGANQLDYLCVPNQAQTLPTESEVRSADWKHYAGKILRINLDGSIPADNPVIHGVKSHVYAWGIRNTQGMVFSPDGKLFAAEQGPNSDDELNLILPGRNYGWPRVAGRKDNLAYAYANYSATEGGCDKVQDPALNGTQVPKGVPVLKESDFHDPDFVEPLKTLFSVDLNQNSFTNPVCAESSLYYICWPTIAPSSVTYYKSKSIPGWENSLLITSLKRGVLYRVQLDHGIPVGDAQPILRSPNRYREVVVSPDGRSIYVATDVDGKALGTNTAGSAAFTFENPGSILVFKYVGKQGGR